MSDIPYVTEADFEQEVLRSDLPVLVDFTATWCGPCKMIAPIVAELHAEWQGRVKVVKCDADTNQDLLARYGIFGIPTLLLFKGGEIKERLTGFQPKKKLVERLTPHL